MEKPIAVLSSNLTQSLEWLRSRYEIETIDILNRWCRAKNGTEYYIVSNYNHMIGFEFSGYIKAPDFETLEDLVKTRIK